MSDITSTSVLAELKRIYLANDNTITPQAVVDDARPEDAPLHDRFEWDDAVAGEQYRLTQAAQLIRSVHVVINSSGPREAVRVRAFLAMPGPDPWRYTAIDDVAKDTDATALILAQMERDVAQLRRKYRDHQAALLQLFAEISEVA